MTLLDEVASEARPSTGCRCCHLLKTLDDADVVDFQTALTRKDDDGRYRYTHRAIVAVLRRRGHDIGESAVARHRTNHQ